jgi:hypothetical protein
MASAGFSRFWALVTSKSGFITVGSQSALTGIITYFGAPVLLPGIETGTVGLPLIGTVVNGRLGLAIYAATATFVGEGLASVTLPLLPASNFLMGAEKTVVGPALTGLSMYGLMKLTATNSADNIGILNFLIIGGGSNIIGGAIARAWQPSLRNLLGS